MFRNLSQKNKGFTIIEIVISILISSIAIAGIFSALLMISILTSDTADRLTATYLAQEGVEIVRNIRDQNWLITGNSWNNKLDVCSLGCEVDYSMGGDGAIRGATGRYLRTDNTNGFYIYEEPSSPNSSKTKFERRIIITQVPDVDSGPNHILRVEVEVSWDKKSTLLSSGDPADVCGKYNCFTVKEILYNWYTP